MGIKLKLRQKPKKDTPALRKAYRENIKAAFKAELNRPKKP